MNKDLPCICGHFKKDHIKIYRVCNGCFGKYGDMKWEQLEFLACKKFKQDNLKYLEMKYEQNLK